MRNAWRSPFVGSAAQDNAARSMNSATRSGKVEIRETNNRPACSEATSIAKANEHGVYEPSEILSAPISKHTGRASVEIRLAQIAEGDWEFGFSYAFNSAGGSSPCKRIDGESPGRYRTRVEAIRAAVQVLTRTLESTSASKAKEMAGVRRWLDKLFTMPDPDWMPEMAREAAQ